MLTVDGQHMKTRPVLPGTEDGLRVFFSSGSTVNVPHTIFIDSSLCHSAELKVPWIFLAQFSQKNTLDAVWPRRYSPVNISPCDNSILTT